LCLDAFRVVEADPTGTGFEPSPSSSGALTGLHFHDGEDAHGGEAAGACVVRPGTLLDANVEGHVHNYKNALLEKPEKTDSYYEALMGKKVRIVTSKYADRFLGQHPKVEETHKYVDAGFTQKTYIKVDGKEYWIFSSSNVKEIEEIDYIIDDVALDLWRQIKAQISCVIVMDVILIVFLLITIVKAKKKKPTASYISMNHFM
jgi:hypothetical protein